MGNTPIWPTWPVTSGEDELLGVVARSGRWDVNSRITGQLTKKMAKYIGMRHCVFFNSGTSALYAAIMTIRSSKSDEIITGSLTFEATGGAILLSGLTPVIVDHDIKTLTPDLAQIKKVITPRTKVIMSLPIYGMLPNTAGIIEIIEEANKEGLADIKLITDACQAVDARENKSIVGAEGEIVCGSFQQSKQLTGGTGGFAATNDDWTAKCLSDFHNHGRVGFPDDTGTNIHGVNLRPHPAALAIVLSQLEIVPGQTEARRRNMKILSDLLQDEKRIILPPLTNDCGPHIYVIRVVDANIKLAFLAELKNRGIPSISGGYPQLLSQNPNFAEGTICLCPNAEMIQASQIWLMHWLFLDPKGNPDQARVNMQYLAQAIREALDKVS